MGQWWGQGVARCGRARLPTGLPHPHPQAEADGDDTLEQGKAIDAMRDMEDRMVLEAELEESFGDGAGQEAGPGGVGKLAMWDWLMADDASAAAIDNTQLEDARLVGWGWVVRAGGRMVVHGRAATARAR